MRIVRTALVTLLLCGAVALLMLWNSGADELAFLATLCLIPFCIVDVRRLTRQSRCSVCGWGFRWGARCTRCHYAVQPMSYRWRAWCLLLGLVLITPEMTDFRCSTERWWVCANEGWLMVHYGWHAPGFELGYGGWPDLHRAVVFPVGLLARCLWLPMVSFIVYKYLCLVLPLKAFPPGHCLHCGYDLTGNVTGVCSECGTPIPPQLTEHATCSK